ncbi:hypothetical protein [Anaerovorax sp. IOR16]|uniref:hypothetical protein n=1 Tax=Anaerovorax sp. IOR16 TaxID=2773458 RepID=UPI0019D09126|nr:hypothetical protein [Anaerovorax sp. IOR16]
MAGTIAGSLIFDTKTDTKGFENGMTDINKETQKLSKSFGRLGDAIIAAFSVNVIKNFGLSIIETAAELQAMDAQFEQIFKESEGEAAMKSINQQSEELGIHVDLLKKSFSSFGAQLKGAGLDAQKALEGTNKATTLAADAAAFYDMSLENASASLSSFLKGNFEAGDAIKVFTTASQMSTKANEVYGKSWDKLTEAEKQWLLLDKVNEVFELNGAVGQAKRESDQWATSVENLKATWARFQESVGADLLNNVTGILQGLTNALGGLTEMMQKNPETTKAFMDTLIAFLASLTTYLAVKNISGLVVGLSAALNGFNIAMAPVALKAALVAGAILLLANMWSKLMDVISGFDTISQVIIILEALTAVAFGAAIAMGAFTTASSMGAAGLIIAASIAAMIASIKIAEASAKKSSESRPSTRSVPRLATGAVIPPNGEFLAVLGDQKYGTNIEAPLSTIEQAVDNVLARRGGTGGGNATVILELDGHELARATTPYNEGESSRRGVRLIKGLT